MSETDAVIAARREAYRVVSWAILAITLLTLVVVGLGLPSMYMPYQLCSIYMLGKNILALR